MIKSLLQLCLEFIAKSCNLEIDIKAYWLNCGMRCIPFKFYHKLLANEYYYCTCRRRTFHITYLERKKNYSITIRAYNCFHCWFLTMIEIKVEKLFQYKNDIVRFASLLSDFFAFINNFKDIYLSPNFENFDYYDCSSLSFSFFLNEYDSCLCSCPLTGPL